MLVSLMLCQQICFGNSALKRTTETGLSTIQASFNLVHRKHTGFRIHIKIGTIVLFMPLVHRKYMDSIAKFPLYAILEKIVGNLACVWF